MDRLYMLMKESAVGCTINRNAHLYGINSDIKCLNYGDKVTPENYSIKPNINDETLDKYIKREIKESVIKAKPFSYKDKNYMIDDNKTLYDFDSWKANRILRVGKIINDRLILFIDENILQITDVDNNVNLYYNIKTSEIFDNNGTILFKLTSGKFKGNEYMYNKKSNIVYD